MRQPDPVVTLNLRDDADHVDGIEAESLAQVGRIFKPGIFLAGVGFEQVDESAADRIAVRHVTPSWLGGASSPAGLGRIMMACQGTILRQFWQEGFKRTVKRGAWTENNNCLSTCHASPSSPSPPHACQLDLHLMPFFRPFLTNDAILAIEPGIDDVWARDAVVCAMDGLTSN